MYASESNGKFPLVQIRTSSYFLSDWLSGASTDPTVTCDITAPWSQRDSDLDYDDPVLGSGTLYRLREGIERFMVTDINNPAGSAQAQNEIAVARDKIEASRGAEGIQAHSHVPGGANVLYMDGHVEFIRYPGERPICRCVVMPWVL